MTVYYSESRGKWRYDFEFRKERYHGYCLDADGKDVTSRRAALDAEAAVRAQLKAAGTKTAARPAGVMLAEAARWHYTNIAVHQGQARQIKQRLGELLKFFGATTDMQDITEERIAEYVLQSRETKVRHWKGGCGKKEHAVTDFDETDRRRTPTTINKYLKLLRLLFKVPAVKKYCGMPEIKLLKQPRRIPTPIDIMTAQRILDHSEVHLQRVILLAIYSGMREREITGVAARQVNAHQRIIYLEETTKSREGRAVYISEALWGTVEDCLQDGWRLWAQLQADAAAAAEYRNKYGITNAGDIPLVLYQPVKGLARPMKSINKSWQSAKRRAGIGGRVRFHDTRASFCSYLAQLGESPVAIQQLAGHKDIKTTMLYIKGSNDSLHASVARLAAGAQLELKPKSHTLVPHKDGEKPENLN